MSGIVFGCIVPHPPLMVPEIGKGKENEIINTIRSMEVLAKKLKEVQPEVIFVISPHSIAHYQAMGVVNSRTIYGDLKGWGASGLNFYFNNDLSAVEILQEECRLMEIPLKPIDEKSYSLDHGILAPFYYLMKTIHDIPVIPLAFSWLSLHHHFMFGQAIRRTVEKMNKRVAIVASGDLSHRLIPAAPAGYDPLGAVFDRKVVDAISTYDVQTILNLDEELIEHAGECGLRSIIILLGALDGLSIIPEVLSYEGPFGVGYMVASFSLKEKVTTSLGTMNPLVLLAKESVENYIRNATVIKPETLSPEMKKQSGVFVCIKKYGDLRGCIGTYEPSKTNIAEEIVASAISAAINDPRFPPVRADELDQVEYTVDVLTPPELIDSTELLDPRRYGLIIEGKGRRGLLLPNIEGVDTIDQQIEITRNKAGLLAEDEISIYRFEVKRYK